MSTEIATTKSALDRLNRSMSKSSLDDLVKSKTRRSLLLVDCSDSMSSRLMTGERSIDALRKIVRKLRESNPVPVAAFGAMGGAVILVDEVPEPCGSTPLHLAIEYGTQQGATHLVVVTDGEPDSETAAFEAARVFGNAIDVFYIGDGGGRGETFARELARRTGGTMNLSDLNVGGEQLVLTAKIAGLLGDGGAL